jgi:hypothetical protein
MLTPKMVEESGPVYEVVGKAKQKEAVDFLNKNLFATPGWLINNDIFSRTGLNGATAIGQVQDVVINRLVSGRILGKLNEAEALMGNNTYLATDLLADLKKGIFTELAGAKPVDLYRRNLQKSYTTALISLLTPATTVLGPGLSITSGGLNEKTDSKSIVRAYLVSLRTEITGAAGRTTDTMTRYHLQDLAERINKALNPKN